MKYNPEIHHRKSIRLKEYDYSQAGYYFVTICAKDRLKIFGKIENGEMIRTEIGNLATKILFDLPNRFKNIEVDAYVLMPNHLHAIIIINDRKTVGVELALLKEENRTVVVELALPKEENRTVVVELALPKEENRTVGVELALPNEDSDKNDNETDRASSVPTLGRIIQVFKSISTIEINRLRDCSGHPVWQRNYYEHIIRNEKELYEIRKYIVNNPLNWNEDDYYS